MPSNFSMSVLMSKIAHCKRLSHEEIQFIEQRYESLKRTYQATLTQCDENERRAIALCEAQCQVEAHRLARDYRLMQRLDDRLAEKAGAAGGGDATDDERLAYMACLACYYEAQMENMLAVQELPLSSEFLSALTDLEAALMHLNDVAKNERTRGQRVWAN